MGFGQRQVGPVGQLAPREVFAQRAALVGLPEGEVVEVVVCYLQEKLRGEGEQVWFLLLLGDGHFHGWGGERVGKGAGFGWWE